jgi:cell wall-associated NlpC family hydrolase
MHTARRAPDPDQLVIAQGDGSPVLQSAAEFLGRPYRFGAQGAAFDCSGFVRTVFAKIGVELPHSTREQFSLGERVGRDELEPGDLVFFRTYRRTASHVGIYVGDGKFVHAATRGGQVQVDSLAEAYYARRYLGARRVES